MEIRRVGGLPSREHFVNEFDAFLKANNKILFAYSGGLDSTVALAKLREVCQQRNIELQLFTVNTMVKGQGAIQNVINVLRYFNLEKNHKWIDISKSIQKHPAIVAITGQSTTTLDVYRNCLSLNILPCGKICNTIMDYAYGRIMSSLGFQVIVTGGDTPKKNIRGNYSLFWKKPSGITVLRGGYAFALTKEQNSDYIMEQGIPWIDPQCGGYDTDCLVPGVFFSNSFNHQAQQNIETILARFPIILNYIAERVRFGVIKRKEGMRMLTHVDIASPESYSELMRILSP